MPWAKPEKGELWGNIRFLLLMGHRPQFIASIYEHLGITVEKIRWRSHKHWKDIHVKRSSHRGPRCPMCRRREKTFKKDLCKTCYYTHKRKGRPLGEDHHAWKGGVTMDPKMVRLSSDYRIFRRTILERDDYQCQVCGVVEDRLEVDHIIPQTARPDLIFVPENARTLCNKCHKRTVTYGNGGHYFKWLFRSKKFTDIERVEKLAALVEKGALSDSEFETMRFIILDYRPAINARTREQAVTRE